MKERVEKFAMSDAYDIGKLMAEIEHAFNALVRAETNRDSEYHARTIFRLAGKLRQTAGFLEHKLARDMTLVDKPERGARQITQTHGMSEIG